MEFGLDKCAKCTISKGRKVTAKNIQVKDDCYIEDLGEDATYKYLGIEESDRLQQWKMRKNVQKEYIKRVKKICKSELIPKNKITAINQLAVPVVTYGFGIIDWPQYEIDKLDVKTRKILTMNRVTYRNQCIDRLYLPRKEGGLGLTEINHAFRATIVSLGQYLKSTQENIMKPVVRHHAETLAQQKSIIKLAENFGQYILTEEKETKAKPATQIARESRARYSKNELRTREERWKQDKRAGKLQEELNKEYIDKEGSLQWLRKGALGYDGERIIMGAQDQGLMTNGFKKMAGLSSSNKCRFCHTDVESTSHLASACKILLADGHYTERHNKVCKYLHWKICNELKIETKAIWEHEPEQTVAKDNVTIFYDKVIPSGRYIPNKAVKPDIVIWNREEQTAKIIEVTVPNDFGINRAEREKKKIKISRPAI